MAAIELSANDPLRLDTMPGPASLTHVTVERLFRLLKAQMNGVLTSHGASIVEWRILLTLIEYGESSQKDLVRDVAMAQAQVSRALSLMQERGLVHAARSAADGRVWFYTATAKGTALYRRLAPAMAARKRRLDHVLDDAEMRTFVALAQKLAGAVSDKDDMAEFFRSRTQPETGGTPK